MPVVSAEGFLPDRLLCVVGEYPEGVEGRYEVIQFRAGVSLGGCHIGVTSREVGHKSVQRLSFCGAPVEEGQQGAVFDRLAFHLQPIVALHVPEQRGCEVSAVHEEEGSWNVSQPGQNVIIRRPPFFEMRHGTPGAPLLRGEQQDGGCVAPPPAYPRGPEYVGGFRFEV